MDAPPDGRTVALAPQFVLVGIDTTPGPDIEHTFSRRAGDAAERAGAHITFFVNTQNFLLSPARRADASLSHEERSWLDPAAYPFHRISYASSLAEIEGRIATTRYLLDHGHEIASHGVHHERGRAWSLDRWRSEFRVFDRFHEDRLGFPAVEGFRAPYLAWSANTNEAERASGILYDASRVSQARSWPTRSRSGGVWLIPVYSGRIGRCRTLFFDDGIRGCRADDDAVYRALLAEFDERYRTSRAPLVLSSHQGYVETAYVHLLQEVCHRPEVRCVTFATLAHWMDEHPEVAGYGDRPGQYAIPLVREPASHRHHDSPERTVARSNENPSSSSGAQTPRRAN